MVETATPVRLPKPVKAEKPTRGLKRTVKPKRR